MSKCHKKNQRKSISNLSLYCTVPTFLVIKQLMGGNQVTLCQYPIPYHLLCVGFNIFINDPAILLFSICWMTLYSKQELHLLFHFIFFCVHGPLLYSVDSVIVLIQQIGVLFFLYYSLVFTLFQAWPAQSFQTDKPCPHMLFTVSEQILALWHAKMLGSLCPLSTLSHFPLYISLLLMGLEDYFYILYKSQQEPKLECSQQFSRKEIYEKNEKGCYSHEWYSHWQAVLATVNDFLPRPKWDQGLNSRKGEWKGWEGKLSYNNSVPLYNFEK